MAEIDILDFLKTGTLSGVRPGDTRRVVENTLGIADDFYEDTLNNVNIYERSPIWVYGGMELHFDPWLGWDDTLIAISFKPFYLFKHHMEVKSKVHRWIFRSRKGPTIQDLLKGLTRHKIQFQDTGLEWIIFDQELKKFILVEYQEELFKEAKSKRSDEEAMGTIVLRSGVQIRYDDTGHVVAVSTSGDWMIKGKEVSITWE